MTATNHFALGIEDFVGYAGVFIAIGNNGININRTIVLGMDGKIRKMGVGHCHKGYIAEDSVGRPVVIIIEIAARELRDYTHGEFLFTLS